ncbi:hypothetical protein [Solimicrobium silvestre]|uniref:Uncharacterized protein n=1 Tax=Solimicrobium silvestre TaxID=2099400 RepID=A0A2S9GWR2_9BURK|nr:hypothetical protein [Solimicrobium silvestre]PRC92165.1 hypothetical protein S2091_3081 [Solimicrobium silvestre]
MNKISLLLIAITLGINYHSTQAQTSPDALLDLSKDISIEPGEIPGFFSSPPGVNMVKNAVKNRDGSKTIKAGQQVPEANDLNRKVCESMGMKDITNENDFTLGAGAAYGGVCFSTEPPRNRSTRVQAIPGKGTGRVFIPIPENDLNKPQAPMPYSTRAPMQIIPYATTGSSTFNQMYYAHSLV